jgi:flavodoxin
MKALVVYESMYGNTRAVAEAIAEGLGGSPVRAVHEAGEAPEQRDLLVVGGPTHMHGLTTALSRRMAADAAREDGHAALEPGATAELGLRAWLRELVACEGVRAAAFDTRLDRSTALTGTAARGIARRLRQRDYEVVATESFLVQDAEGPLEDGELERARAWGEQLARLVGGEA